MCVYSESCVISFILTDNHVNGFKLILWSCFTALLVCFRAVYFHLYILQFDTVVLFVGIAGNRRGSIYILQWIWYAVFKLWFCHSCFWFILSKKWLITTFLKILFLPGLEVREAEQHARKWLWQYIQWLWDGWFRVRASPNSNWETKDKRIQSKRVLLVKLHAFLFQKREAGVCFLAVNTSSSSSEFHLCSLCRRGRLRTSGWLGEGTSIPELDDLEMESDPSLPSTEDVIRKTEQITKNIQELLRAAQDNKHDRSELWDKNLYISLGWDF